MIKKISNNSNILIVYTGGTIGMIKDYETDALKAFDFSQIFDRMPELQNFNCKISSVSLDQPIDSSNMTIESYYRIGDVIANSYDDYDGFVVLSGTDTMSYISSALSFMFENLQKPIIFTGSQLPIGDLRTDAKENLITAIEIASAKKNNKAIVKEVALYFEYKLLRANRTIKINAETFEAFASINYPPLAESGVTLQYHKKNLLKKKKGEKTLFFRKNLINDIVVLKLFPGLTKNTVESIIGVSNIKGVIIESFGSGNAPTSSWFIDLLEKTIQKGVPVVNVTQCLGGSVVFGLYETSSELQKIGVINGKDITTESAIAKMMYLLGQNLDSKQFKVVFETSLRGEMS